MDKNRTYTCVTGICQGLKAGQALACTVFCKSNFVREHKLFSFFLAYQARALRTTICTLARSSFGSAVVNCDVGTPQRNPLRIIILDLARSSTGKAMRSGGFTPNVALSGPITCLITRWDLPSAFE